MILSIYQHEQQLKQSHRVYIIVFAPSVYLHPASVYVYLLSVA